MKDNIKITDMLIVNNMSQNQQTEHSFVEGYFSIVARERGKIVPGTRREGHNIWTFTGREYLTRLMSYVSYTGPTFTVDRNDRIFYMGLGIGTGQPEVDSVFKLENPVAYDLAGALFLKQIQAVSYPEVPGKTVVQYDLIFNTDEVSGEGPVLISEAGLFTDKEPPNFTEPRSTAFSDANLQSPMAYKAFEPLKKTSNFSLDIQWQLRF